MSVSYSEASFDNSKYDNIYYQSWSPSGEVKAVIMLAHGMSEHSSRYTPLVDHLVAKQYAVHAWDHPGHGRSGGHRKFIHQFSDFTDVMAENFQLVKQQYPNLPIYVIAHSMGGLISVNYLLDHQAEFAGAILSAPAIKPSSGLNPVMVAAGKLFAAIWPKFEFESVNARDVCRDSKVVERFKLDPLSTSGRTSIRLLAELVRGMERVQDEANSLTLPMLVLQGTDDRIVDPNGASDLLELASSNDKTLTHYQDFYHELFNDTEKDRVFEDVSAWLDMRVG